MGATIMLALGGCVFMALGSFAKVTVNDEAQHSLIGWVRLLAVTVGALCWRFA